MSLFGNGFCLRVGIAGFLQNEPNYSPKPFMEAGFSYQTELNYRQKPVWELVLTIQSKSTVVETLFLSGFLAKIGFVLQKFTDTDGRNFRISRLFFACYKSGWLAEAGEKL